MPVSDETTRALQELAEFDDQLRERERREERRRRVRRDILPYPDNMNAFRAIVAFLHWRRAHDDVEEDIDPDDAALDYFASILYPNDDD